MKPPHARPVNNVLLCHKDDGQGQQGKLLHHIAVIQLMPWALDWSPKAQPSFSLPTKPHLRQEGLFLKGLSKDYGGLGSRVTPGPPGETSGFGEYHLLCGLTTFSLNAGKVRGAGGG